MSTRKPSLPAIPNDVSPSLRSFFEALKESIEVWDGKRGDNLDRVLTVRDLIGSGMAQLKRNESGMLASGSSFEGVANLDYSIPPSLKNLTANGAFTAIFLSWDKVAYTNLSHVEVWRSNVDDLGQATLVGSTSANVFMDYVGGSSTYYYWIRPVTTANITGPYNGTAGTMAATDDDPAYLLQVLSGSIAESELSQSLNTRLDTADGQIVAHSESINGLSAQYTVKIDVNGYVAGYGLAVESSQAGANSLFLVNADRFAISHPNATGNTIPFIVDSGKTYINSAVIKDASITSAKIGNLAAEKISAGTINAALTLNAAAINGGSLNINNKFVVDTQGNTTIRSGTTGARLELVNNVIRVYDESGTLRVKIGNLA